MCQALNQWEALSCYQLAGLAGKRLDWPTLDASGGGLGHSGNFLILSFNTSMTQSQCKWFPIQNQVTFAAGRPLNVAPRWPTGQSESALPPPDIWNEGQISAKVSDGEESQPLSRCQGLLRFSVGKRKVFPWLDECAAGSDSFICPPDDVHPSRDKVMEGGNKALCKNKHPLSKHVVFVVRRR